MSAWDYGLQEGRRYIDEHEDVVVSAYRAEGRRRSEQYVKADRARAFYAGWLKAGGLPEEHPQGEDAHDDR